MSGWLRSWRTARGACLLRSVVAGAAVVVLGLLGPARAEAAEITGQIDGFELAAQGGSHGAIFVFGFEGELNGRSRSGWGWIEVLHDPLPEAGGSTLILGGRGALWIGPRRFRIVVMQGVLTSRLAEPAVFDVTAPLDVAARRGGPEMHLFDGTLSHLTFPPTIGGSVEPE